MARDLLPRSLFIRLMLFGCMISPNALLEHFAGQDAPPTAGRGACGQDAPPTRCGGTRGASEISIARDL